MSGGNQWSVKGREGFKASFQVGQCQMTLEAFLGELGGVQRLTGETAAEVHQTASCHVRSDLAVRACIGRNM